MSVITVTTTEHPIVRFREWYEAATKAESRLPEAVALATASADGRPSLRMVLLKDADERGFVFYTNTLSRKGRELAENPRAALCFHWKSLDRSVRVEGRVEPVTAAEADAYFASRPRNSQIGAWASKQSATLESRFELEKRVARYAARFLVGPVPRPEFWSGFRIVPDRVEFWEERPFRLHDRLAYTLGDEGWTTEKLYP